MNKSKEDVEWEDIKEIPHRVKKPASMIKKDKDDVEEEDTYPVPDENHPDR